MTSRVAYATGDSHRLKQSRTVLAGLLALLRALHWHYWTAHWQSRGDSSYGDHLLFERFYSGMVEEIDTLAEKIAGFFGWESVSSVPQSSLTRSWLERWEMQGDIFNRSLAAEADLQQLLTLIRMQLESSGHLTLGLDDYLAALSNAHETNVYLVQQRIAPRRTLASLVKTAEAPPKIRGKEEKSLEKAKKKKKRKDPGKRIKSFGEIKKRHRLYLESKRNEKDPAKKKVKFKTPESYASFLATQGFWGWEEGEVGEGSESGAGATKEEQARKLVESVLANFEKMGPKERNELHAFFTDEYVKAAKAGADMDEDAASLALLEKTHQKSLVLTGQKKKEEPKKEEPEESLQQKAASAFERMTQAVEQATEGRGEKEKTEQANQARAVLAAQVEEDYQNLIKAENEALDDLKRKMSEMGDEEWDQLTQETANAGLTPVWKRESVPPDPEEPPPKEGFIKKHGLLGIVTAFLSFFRGKDPRTLAPKKPSFLARLLFGNERAREREEEKLATRIEEYELKETAKNEEKMVKSLTKKAISDAKQVEKGVDYLVMMMEKANFPNFDRLTPEQAKKYGLLKSESSKSAPSSSERGKPGSSEPSTKGKVIKPSKGQATKIRRLWAAHAVQSMGFDTALRAVYSAISTGKVSSYAPFHRYGDYKLVFASDPREMMQGAASIILDRMTVPPPSAISGTLDALNDEENFDWGEEGETAEPKAEVKAEAEAKRKKLSRQLVARLNQPDLFKMGRYFEGPWHSEVRQLVRSGEPSNLSPESQARGAPPTPADLKDQPGGSEFSTLHRYVTQTAQKTPPGFRPFRGDR